MLLSQTGRYALRAALHLGDLPPGEFGTAAEISRAIDVPRNYLSKILHVLARAGVLESVRGPGGGFRLAASPAQTSLVRILEPLESGRGSNRRCLLGRARCSDLDPCAVHADWLRLAERIERFMGETTLGSLRERRRSPPRRRSARGKKSAKKTTAKKKRRGGSR